MLMKSVSLTYFRRPEQVEIIVNHPKIEEKLEGVEI